MIAEEKRISPGVVIVGGLGLGLAAALALGAMALAAPPPGRANLYGKVTDAVTGTPLSGVLISLNGLEVYTDASGNYSFADIEPGNYVATFSKSGYQTAIY